jgi:hypothetical protein
VVEVGGKEIETFFGYGLSWLGTKSPTTCQERERENGGG